MDGGPPRKAKREVPEKVDVVGGGGDNVDVETFFFGLELLPPASPSLEPRDADDVDASSSDDARWAAERRRPASTSRFIF